MTATVSQATFVRPNVVWTTSAGDRGVGDLHAEDCAAGDPRATERGVHRSGFEKGLPEWPREGCPRNVLSEPKIRLRIRGEWPELDYSAANPG